MEQPPCDHYDNSHKNRGRGNAVQALVGGGKLCCTACSQLLLHEKYKALFSQISFCVAECNLNGDSPPTKAHLIPPCSPNVRWISVLIPYSPQAMTGILLLLFLSPHSQHKSFGEIILYFNSKLFFFIILERVILFQSPKLFWVTFPYIAKIIFHQHFFLLHLCLC